MAINPKAPEHSKMYLRKESLQRILKNQKDHCPICIAQCGVCAEPQLVFDFAANCANCGVPMTVKPFLIKAIES